MQTSPQSNNESSVLLWARENQKRYLLRDFYTFARHSGIAWSITDDPYRQVCDYLESLLPITPRITAWRKEYGRIAHVRRPGALLRAFFMMPRLTFKTTLIKALCAFAQYIDEDIRVVLGRATIGDASDTLRGVRSTLESNQVLLAAFGNVRVRYSEWSDLSITIRDRQPGISEPTIDTTGLDSSKTGSHVHMALLDDLVHENNYTSATEMEKAYYKVQAFNPVVERGGTILITGTRWGDNDAYGRIIEEDERREERSEDAQWEKLIWGATHDDGRLRFPDVLSADRLADLRENTDPKLYSAWYENKARAAGEEIFSQSYIQPFDGDFVPGPYPKIVFPQTEINAPWLRRFNREISVSTVMLVDPALTVGPRSDFTGYVVVAFDSLRNWWIMEGHELKMLPTPRLDYIIRGALEYTPAYLVIENADLDAPLMQDRLREAGLSTKVVAFNPRMDRLKITADPKLSPRGMTSKGAQIEKMEPTMRGLRMYFRRGATSALTRQIVKYPYLVHDDVIDALSMGQAYETKAQEYIDRDPERVFREIEAAEFRLEGLDFEGNDLDLPIEKPRLPNRR